MRLVEMRSLPALDVARTLSKEFAAVFTDDMVSGRLRRIKQQIEAIPEADEPLAVEAVGPAFVGPRIAFWDLETTYSTQPRLLTGAVADAWGDVELFDLRQYPGTTWTDDRALAVAIRDRLETYPIICGWYSKHFDVPVLNGRLAFHGERPLRAQMHIDLHAYSGGGFVKIGRRSLESVSKFFSSPHAKTPLDPQTWDRADHGSVEDYDLICTHNIADVLVTRDVYAHLEPHIRLIHRAG
jgi:uncharacterized protein YprB with RNaseH-like and TPR domain